MGSNYIITSNGNFISEDEMYHWGIKGMKWGVRRYQNADGSLTAAGRKRYTNSDGSLNEKGKKYYAKEAQKIKKERAALKAQQKTDEQLAKLAAKRKENDDLKKQINSKRDSKNESQKSKTAKTMTDAELDAAIVRARKEDEYNRLRPEATKKSGFMDELVTNVIKPAVLTSGKNALASMMDKAVKDLMKDKIDPNSYEALKKTYDKLKLKADIEALKDPMNAAYNTAKKEYDTMKLQKDTEDLKSGKTKELTWDDKLKKQQYERNKADSSLKNREDAVKAREDAVKAKEDSLKNTNSQSSNKSNKQTADEVKDKGKKETERAVANATKNNKSSNETNSKDYEKRVQSLLDEIDRQGWDDYYSGRKRGDW